MKALEGLEGSLNDVFGKNAPALPKGFKDFLVKVAPWLSLIGGIFGIYAAWQIYHWTTVSEGLTDYLNTISKAYGGSVIEHSWTFWLYIAVAVLLITSVIYLLAFAPLQKYQKAGWDYLFFALILNLVYGLVVAFTNYGTVGNLIFSLIGSAIGAYFLFQVRDYYTGKAKVGTAAGANSKSSVKQKK